MTTNIKVDDIKKITELMSRHDVCEIAIESKDMKLMIKRASGVMAVAAPAPVMMAAAPALAAAPAAVPAPAAAPAAAVAAPAATIDSPLVGTFYASPSPDAPAFVKEGSKITPDTTICIIEAMKVMNEIKAEKSGVIRKVLAVNGKPVQFGQPLFEIDPA